MPTPSLIEQIDSQRRALRTLGYSKQYVRLNPEIKMKDLGRSLDEVYGEAVIVWDNTMPIGFAYCWADHGQ